MSPPVAHFFACAIAVSQSKNRPPSEKESGVTLTTPITNADVETRIYIACTKNHSGLAQNARRFPSAFLL